MKNQLKLAITAAFAIGFSGAAMPVQSASAEPLSVRTSGPPRITAPQPYRSYCKIVINGVENWRPCPGWRQGRVD